MTWEFKSTPKETEAYLFDGIYIIEPSVFKTFTAQELQSAFKLVFDRAVKNSGLAPVQKLTHSTSGKVIQLIHSLSEEMKDELMDGHLHHRELINQVGDILVMFPDEKIPNS